MKSSCTQTRTKANLMNNLISSQLDLYSLPISWSKNTSAFLKTIEKRTFLIAVIVFNLMVVFYYCFNNYCKTKKAKNDLKNVSFLPLSTWKKSLKGLVGKRCGENLNLSKGKFTKTEKPFIELIRNNHLENSVETLKILPSVERDMKQDFFVDVLNSRGYSLNEKNVILPPAQKPIKFARANDKSFEESIEIFKKEYQINNQNKIQFQFKDLSTEQAINESNALRIALNFANEHHAGGGPGYHKDKETGIFVYDAPSAKAQEESICQRSDLMVSLTQLPHTLKEDFPGSNFIRSYYDDEFDSRKMAYGSLNHLFGVQENQDFYQTCYLEEPKSVLFVTSAATCYGNEKDLDCRKDSEVYLDAKQRIETHLLAAAFFSKEIFREDESNHPPIELILGAFGCGAFAPHGNPDEYRAMIANIYVELLPKFHGIFDVVTFAVPTFGDTNRKKPAVANHHVFKRVLSSTLHNF